ncbi:MAG TPA: glycosyltransferase family 9 protein [Opitutaceae bacterium]
MLRATPTSSTARPRLLVSELWGLGDVVLALPFLQDASAHADVTLLAKPHAGPLLHRFAPAVAHLPLVAPWTSFSGKYRLHRWPWRALRDTVARLRSAPGFDLGVSARADPRDHALLALAGVRRKIGFPRAGSRLLLDTPLLPPARPHRAEHWRALATALGGSLPSSLSPAPCSGETGRARPRHLVLHPGAGHAVRRWPAERYADLAGRLRQAGWDVYVVDDPLPDDAAVKLDALLGVLEGAAAFIGNDSGPGHLAALLGVPTFTIFGPQLPELFAPRHSRAAWIEGAPCPHKPCFDACRFTEPHCIRALTVDEVWARVKAWCATLAP